LVEIAGAIDLWNREHGEEESIPTSKPWKKKGISTWEDADLESLKKTIAYALKQAGKS
jgi:hypothetical protein